jgi:hypothetical protein
MLGSQRIHSHRGGSVTQRSQPFTFLPTTLSSSLCELDRYHSMGDLGEIFEAQGGLCHDESCFHIITACDPLFLGVTLSIPVALSPTTHIRK